MWHNEALIAPYFLNHYAYADKIHLIMGKDTTDESRDICAGYPNVEIEDFTFPDMLINDIIKSKKMSTAVAGQGTDWAYAVDSDEFVFPANGESPQDVLGRQTGNLLYAKLWMVYRHKADSDLDPTKPPVYQRRHGNPSFATPGAYKTQYIKPIIVRPSLGVEWYPGCHMCKYTPGLNVSDESFLGVHWNMADERIAVSRRVDGRRGRMSADNIRFGMGEQDFNVTEEEIRAECKSHLHDPQLF
jgi:hypothetical protein